MAERRHRSQQTFCNKIGAKRTFGDHARRPLFGLQAGEILHLAQSRCHDIAIARTLGYKICWIERRQGMAVRWHEGPTSIHQTRLPFLDHNRPLPTRRSTARLETSRMAMFTLEVRHAPHFESSKAIWFVGVGIHDWRRAGHDIRNQMARAWANTKAMTAETRRQYQAR